MSDELYNEILSKISKDVSVDYVGTTKVKSGLDSIIQQMNIGPASSQAQAITVEYSVDGNKRSVDIPLLSATVSKTKYRGLGYLLSSKAGNSNLVEYDGKLYYNKNPGNENSWKALSDPTGVSGKIGNYTQPIYDLLMSKATKVEK
jgi:hypothetical protein